MEKRAQQRLYQLNPDAMHELEGWAEQMVQLWNQRFDALDKLLEIEKSKIAKDEMARLDQTNDQSNEGKA